MGAIAVIGGTGHHGFALAARLCRGGHRVIVGSREEARAMEAASRIRALITVGEVTGAAKRQVTEAGKWEVTGAGNQEAAAAAEVVVLTIPFAAQDEILTAIAPAVSGKVVVDTTVPLRRGTPPELEPVAAGSAAQAAQARLPDARVVAAFHTLSAALLARLDQPLEGDTLLCGNDAEAKRAVAELAETLGVRALDAGPLGQAGALERLAALIIGLNKRYGRKAIGVRFTGV
ncbi:MAG TPA: NADPH-dependent F420 reductase [bacterium]|jgi:hypothetical protein|nr:NADPH-dependent F420 reductase [bacterium]